MRNFTMINSKKAVQWYVVASLIMLAVAAVFIIGYLSGAFNKIGNVGDVGLFGWLKFGK